MFFRSTSFCFLLLIALPCSADFVGQTSNENVVFVDAGPAAPLGTFDVLVTRPGARASVTATTQQQFALAADENLAINEILIVLDAGMIQSQVIQRINEHSSETNAFADIDPSGYTRIFSSEFGSNTELFVVSDMEGAGSTGFTLTNDFDTGENIFGSIGGKFAEGIGSRLNVSDIELEFLPESDNPLNTVSGKLGTVTISIPEPGTGVLIWTIVLCYAQTRRRQF